MKVLITTEDDELEIFQGNFEQLSYVYEQKICVLQIAELYVLSCIFNDSLKTIEQTLSII